MGLMDQIKGMFGGSDQSLDAVFDSVKNMVGEGGQGLQGMLDKFDAAGLGDKVKSWVGTGDNAELTPAEVEAALGPDKVKELADKAGIDPAKAEEGLSKFIPEFVNKLTPDGSIPSTDQMKDMLSKIPGIGDLLK